MSWKHLEDIFARHLENLLKTSWRLFQNVLKMHLQAVFKTSWRRLEEVFWRRKAKANIQLDQDVFWRQGRKTSSSRWIVDGMLHIFFTCRCVSKRSCTFITVITQIRTFSVNLGTFNKNFETTEYSLERSYQKK